FNYHRRGQSIWNDSGRINHNHSLRGMEPETTVRILASRRLGGLLRLSSSQNTLSLAIADAVQPAYFAISKFRKLIFCHVENTFPAVHPEIVLPVFHDRRDGIGGKAATGGKNGKI